jgi:hypothetical protein
MSSVRRKSGGSRGKGRNADGLLQRGEPLRVPGVRQEPQERDRAPGKVWVNLPDFDSLAGRTGDTVDAPEKALVGSAAMNSPAAIPADLSAAAARADAPALDPAAAAIPPATAPAAPAAISWESEAREIVGIVASLRFVFPSLAAVYTPEAIAELSRVWAPVLERHNLTFGRFTIYVAAGGATLPVAVATWQGVRSDLAVMKKGQVPAAAPAAAPAEPAPDAPAPEPEAPSPVPAQARGRDPDLDVVNKPLPTRGPSVELPGVI